MKLRMSLEGPHADRELRSLYHWLRERRSELDESGISVHALERFPEQGEMGGAFEVIQFVIGTATDLSALAIAVAAWRGAHAARSEGCLTGEDGQGGQRLTPQELAETRTVLRALRSLRDGADGADDGGETRDGSGDDSQDDTQDDTPDRGDRGNGGDGGLSGAGGSGR